jgi:hypothetical protein
MAEYREIPEVAAATARLVRAVGRRVQDPEDLTELVKIRDALDEAFDIAVHHLREERSYEEIGKALGVTRQAVAQRWPRKSAAEKWAEDRGIPRVRQEAS